MRDTMRNMWIGFSKPKNKIFPIFSWAIRAIDGTEFSHVYVRSQTKYGVDLIYQASGAQVNFMSSEIFELKNHTLREFEFVLSEECFERYMNFALKNCGKPYGILQVLGIAIYTLFPIKKNPFPSGSANYVCSELVAEILFEIGKFEYDRDIFDKLTPKDIFDFCLTHLNEETIQ